MVVALFGLHSSPAHHTAHTTPTRAIVCGINTSRFFARCDESGGTVVTDAAASRDDGANNAKQVCCGGTLATTYNCEPSVKQLTKLFFFFFSPLTTNGTFCFIVNYNRYEQIIVNSGSGIEIWNPPLQVSSSFPRPLVL